jgi:hypothetical protein
MEKEGSVGVENLGGLNKDQHIEQKTKRLSILVYIFRKAHGLIGPSYQVCDNKFRVHHSLVSVRVVHETL